MTLPSSLSAASWIWAFCAVFTTFAIAGVLVEDVLTVVTAGVQGAQGGVLNVEVMGVTGWLVAIALIVVMVGQVVAAMKLRDGAPWARTALSFVAFCSLMAVVYDPTMLAAWVLLVANLVAVILANRQVALDYVVSRPRSGA